MRRAKTLEARVEMRRALDEAYLTYDKEMRVAGKIKWSGVVGWVKFGQEGRGESEDWKWTGMGRWKS